MMIRIQPGSQPDLPSPIPYHILDNGDVYDQDVWRGDPAALIGFQNRPDVQHIDLLHADWWHEPQTAIGKYPVFVTDHGTTWALTIAVAEVTTFESPHESLAAWTVTARTQRGDYNAAIATSVVYEQATGRHLVTANVFISPADGAVVVDIVDASADIPLRVDINDDTIHNDTIPS